MLTLTVKGIIKRQLQLSYFGKLLCLFLFVVHDKGKLPKLFDLEFFFGKVSLFYMIFWLQLPCECVFMWH